VVGKGIASPPHAIDLIQEKEIPCPSNPLKQQFLTTKVEKEGVPS
jgi:hypothetical protein